MRVRSVPSDEIVVREADGLNIVHHRTSGETHVLAPELLTVLDAIADGPLDVGGVVARLSELYELEADDVRGAVAARLDQLVALGLAETAE